MNRRRWQLGNGRSFKGRYFRVGSWQFFTNCHTRWSLLTQYRRHDQGDLRVRNIVVLGIELSWWRV